MYVVVNVISDELPWGNARAHQAIVENAIVWNAV